MKETEMHKIEKKTDLNVDILGVPVFGGTKAEVIRKVGLVGGVEGITRPFIILTPTTEQVVMAQRDDLLCASFAKADINLPDTWGLWWASRILWLKDRSRKVITERMTGVDVAEEVALQTLQQGKKVFLLGGHTSAASAAERFKILDIRFKELIGFDEGVKDIRNEKHEERRKILEKIANFRPHLLLVAYGAPWQEWWVTANREVLGKAGVRVVMVVGGAFDMWAGKTPRAPILLRKAGLEWLWRLILEPWRIKRQLKLIKFIWMVLNK